MIALDSNVVLRFLIDDGSPQCALAAKFVQRELSVENPGFISLPVACELVWVMTRAYKLPQDEVLKALRGLLAARQIRFEREQTLAAAVANVGDFDISDSIIHAIGQVEGCSHTVTFDKVFAKMKDVNLVTAA